MEKITITIIERENSLEYYLRNNLFFVHVKPLKEEVWDGIVQRDFRRDLSERVMFCTLASLGYDPQFNLI